MLLCQLIWHNYVYGTESMLLCKKVNFVLPLCERQWRWFSNCVVSSCRKWPWSSQWSTTIVSEHLSRLDAACWAAHLPERNYVTGATCLPTRADRLRSGTLSRKSQRRARSRATWRLAQRQTGSVLTDTDERAVFLHLGQSNIVDLKINPIFSYNVLLETVHREQWKDVENRTTRTIFLLHSL